MQPEEVLALGNLTGEALSEATGYVHDVHSAVASRVWSGLGPAAAPVRLVHDALATAVYASVGRSLGLAARTGARALSLAAAPDADALAQGTRARIAIGVLNGAFGDSLERHGNPLSLRMAVRHQGRDLESDPASLSSAFPEATGRLAVFVHGLCETDDAWRLGDARHPPYGARLQAELGYTPLYVRYNSGRPIADNGRDLARLLRAVVASWPTSIGEIVLIGHGTGGLVAASACQEAAGSQWETRVREVLTLGSPEHTAALERSASLASAALARLRETKGLSAALNRRSAAIKELRGSHSPHVRRGRHHVIDYRRFAGLHQFELLNHPAIYEQIRNLLRPAPGLPAPRRQLPPPAAASQRP